MTYYVGMLKMTLKDWWDETSNWLRSHGLAREAEIEAEVDDEGLIRQEADPEEPLVQYNVGCVFALLGETERAIDCIERAATLGGWREWIANDSDLDSLRDHPRFKALLERL